jgi:hypothetical protein
MNRISRWQRWLTSGVLAIVGCADDGLGGRRLDPPADRSDASAPFAEADGGEDSPACTYYVSPSGDDHNSGRRPNQAWAQLERANQQAFAGGESLCLEGGMSFAGTLRFDAADGGRADAPIRVGSFGHGRATIEAGADSALSIENTAGLIVEDLVLHGLWQADAQTGNAADGVSAINHLGAGRQLAFLQLNRLEVSGFKTAGIALRAMPPDDGRQGGFADVTISDCSVHDNGDFGVTTVGPFNLAPGYSHKNVTLRGLRVFRQRGLQHKGSHTGSGIVLEDVDGALVEQSVAYGNGEFNDNPNGGGYGIWAWDSRAVTIQHNESYGNRTMTKDGGGFDLDGGVTDSSIQYNFSHDNQGAGYGAFQFEGARPYGNNLTRYNISQNDGFGMLVWDGNGDMGSLGLAQNVAYGAAAMFVTYSPLPALHAINNVFFGTGALLLDIDSAGLVLDGNVYWSGGGAFAVNWDSGMAAPQHLTSFGDFQAQTAQEAHGLNVDPQLMAAGGAPNLDDPSELASLTMYQPQPDSPLIDRGVDPARYAIAQADRDFFGVEAPRGTAVDIGVAEAR